MTDSRSLEDLWDSLLDGVAEEQMNMAVSGRDINEQAAARLSGDSDRKRMKFRLHGRGVSGHEVATRAAASALVAFQEVVTSVGAAMVDRATAAGQVSGDIIAATELRLTPSVAPGSLILTLVPAVETPERRLFDEDETSLLEASLRKTFQLLHDAGSDAVSDDKLVTDVRSLGTRARKHLLELSTVLISEHVELDLDWGSPDGDRMRVGVTSRAASHLKRLAGEKAKSTKTAEMVGWLVTVSSEIPQALRMDDGEKVSLLAEDQLQATLAQYFGRRVRVSVMTEVTANLSSGVETKRHHLRSIQLDTATAPSSARA
ncbi:hypothetical protein [Cellulosimicrobium funkei]|uniref:hypothetical protein n=1 Tax=Cellulosimicrobium funkei TaxID=264251 RepID=UPI0037DD0B1F